MKNYANMLLGMLLILLYATSHTHTSQATFLVLVLCKRFVHCVLIVGGYVAADLNSMHTSDCKSSSDCWHCLHWCLHVHYWKLCHNCMCQLLIALLHTHWFNRYNQMAALQWCREQGYGWNADACTAAAVGGHCSMVQYLHQQGMHNIYICTFRSWQSVIQAVKDNALV
jgi:hypothetical protein